MKSTGSKRSYWCWWRMLETKCVGDRFNTLDNPKHNDSVINISNRSTTHFVSNIRHQHQWNRFEPVDSDHIVNNITMSPTSLSLLKTSSITLHIVWCTFICVDRGVTLVCPIVTRPKFFSGNPTGRKWIFFYHKK